MQTSKYNSAKHNYEKTTPARITITEKMTAAIAIAEKLIAAIAIAET
jgi:hypothetical protein